MEWGDWIAVFALVLGGFNSWQAAVKARRERDRLDAAERRLGAQDTTLLLVEIRQRLQQLHDGVIEHLGPGGGGDSTSDHLTTQMDEAAFWGERAVHTDVRDAARVLVKVAAIARNVSRDDPEAHKEKVRRTVRDAMRDVSNAIGPHIDELHRDRGIGER